MYVVVSQATTGLSKKQHAEVAVSALQAPQG